MATSNYLSDYERATGAYISGNYAEAASITDALLREYDHVPNLHLLRGHIYLCTQNYAQARAHYQRVLALTDDPELVEYARNGINDADHYLSQQGSFAPDLVEEATQPLNGEGLANPFVVSDLDTETPTPETWASEEPAAENPFAGVETQTEENPFAAVEEETTDNLGGDRTLIFSRPTPASPATTPVPPEPFPDTEPEGHTEQEPADAAADTLLMDLDQRSQRETTDEPGLFSFQEMAAPTPADNTDALLLQADSAVTRPGLKQQPAASASSVGPAPLAVSPPRQPARRISQSLVTGAVVAVLAGVPALGVPNKPLGAVLAAVLGGGAAVVLGGSSGSVKTQRVRQFCEELRLSCEALGRGEFQSALSVVGQDEFAEAAVAFNQMLAQIQERFKQLQETAEEVERSREDLQRQVIRLLDDVEGAARGDLTVQAEVSADILGAVADSFNLIIQNIRQIVQQVKTSALQVGRSAMDSEYFARELSSNALRQAQELASTLNSVQMMTDSIQRVAESAREAAEVARKASETALRGGEAVDQTVAGIQSIRESVAETTRKVKRLAESSQEINKIVNSIGQIAQRTNLLALNASIEAAKAGEAGRGFAIVADEVRQLADRTSRASKEIEQIVLQIQSETGLVMTAMEEGTQAVIRGTRVAEQAKRALEEIIQVSKQIDDLVQSITADTVRQTEVSRNVTQVMQSVELTAQETSQEAQRVSVALQNLVEVSRGLQASVERFRLGTTEPL
ncbi:MAG: methyl-accepting chemotaxis protein [Gloeomargarita sp. SKYBB_i_bin120]|nr:methyl-accepting chemotaxis protein [Gloeomargarita sp. SKYG98]MCS7292536.1 methyl-accepting chemotaxis protein [Gloeomargarita sp. SKYB120]MDW8178097.1 methyl-accepting chemotaxis protein [Gloeomargarita sp. SKYBB_i_bin120]